MIPVCELHERQRELEEELHALNQAVSYFELWLKQAELIGLHLLIDAMRFINAEGKAEKARVEAEAAEIESVL